MEIARKYDTYTWSENGKRILEYDLKTNVIIGKSGQELKNIPDYADCCNYFYALKVCHEATVIELINRFISLKEYNVYLHGITRSDVEFCLEKKNWKMVVQEIKQNTDESFCLHDRIKMIKAKSTKLYNLFSDKIPQQQHKIVMRDCLDIIVEIEQVSSPNIFKDIKKCIEQYVSDCQTLKKIQNDYPFIKAHLDTDIYSLLHHCLNYAQMVQNWAGILSFPPIKHYHDFTKWQTEANTKINNIAETVYFDSLPSALAFETQDYVIHIPKNHIELNFVSERFHNCAASFEYNNYLKTRKRFLVWAECKTEKGLDICIDMSISDLTICQALTIFNRSIVNIPKCMQFCNEYQNYLKTIERN